jgi:peptidoglycan/xylan/chitin deacetylase (PgdA/CDA1 family)
MVALTFDDGPDPAWMPRVLDALDAPDARATFFVVGDPVWVVAAPAL